MRGGFRVHWSGVRDTLRQSGLLRSGLLLLLIHHIQQRLQHAGIVHRVHHLRNATADAKSVKLNCPTASATARRAYLSANARDAALNIGRRLKMAQGAKTMKAGVCTRWDVFLSQRRTDVG